MPYMLDRRPPPISTRPILFIDLEFTGLDPNIHEIIEVAALVIRQPDFKITNSYYTKVIPQHIHTADPKPLEISGYSAKDWQDALSLRQVLQDLSQLAPDCLLAGWVVQNEWNFLNSALQKEKLPYFYSHHLIEVYTLAFVKFHAKPNIQYINLSTIAKTLNIPIQRHKPDSDIRATYEIFKQLQKPVSEF